MSSRLFPTDPLAAHGLQLFGGDMMAAIQVKYTSYVTLTRLLGAAIGLALALGACTSTPLPSTNRASKSALGDVLFLRAGSLFTIGADGRNEKLIHESWDGIGLSPDGHTLTPSAHGSAMDLWIVNATERIRSGLRIPLRSTADTPG